MIRAARPADAAEIAALWNEVIRTGAITFTTQDKTVPVIARMIAERPVLVAEGSGRFQGFATFGPFRSGPGYADAAEHTIMLAPGARGRGLGRALLAALEAEARARGILHLVAGISGSNPPAVAFHAAMGFAQMGRMPEIGHKHGARHDLVLMMKKLAPAT